MSAIAEISHIGQLGASKEASLAQVIPLTGEQDAQQSDQVDQDVDVLTGTYVCPDDPSNPKTIALLGATLLEGNSKILPSVIRMGGSKLVVARSNADCNDTITEMYDRAMRAEEEHPSFFEGLRRDQFETWGTKGIDFIRESGAIVDYVWLMPVPGKLATWAMVSPSKRFSVSPGNRRYTHDLLSILLPMTGAAKG